MTVQTARDILDRARYFHQQLHAYYEALKGRLEQPKLHLILDYLMQHEERMEQALEDYEDDIADKVAETWFKYSPEMSIDEAISNIKITKDMSLDQLMTIAIQLENHFVRLYEHAADQAVSPDVKEVFEQLKKETMKDRTKLSRDLVDMQDLI